MESLDALLNGFGVALQPGNLLWALLGVALGTAVGILPGIGPALTVALLLPVTYGLEPVSAFILFAGIYYGAMYGGSTTSILLNTPGESASMITALEGHQMARAGRASAALATAAIGSFVAGTIGTVGLTIAAPALAQLALTFGPAEYFALMVVGFTTISALLGASMLRGLTSLFFGLTLGLVGIDLQTGQARYTLGIPQLLDGISVVVVVVGLFAVGETLFVASQPPGESVITKVRGWTWMTGADWARSWKPWLRGTGLGFFVGALPTGGPVIPTFLSYWLEKRLSKNPQEFGQGAIEGVAGPEAANNAAAAAVLVPLLTLGLPASAMAAILLAAFQQYNLQPGPLLFVTNPSLVWGLIASLYLGNLMLLVLNLPLAPLWARLLEIPSPLLYGGILVFATLGTYSLNNSAFDVGLMYVIGVVGFGMRRFDFPVAPAIIGLILGPLAEQQFRRALAISQGDLSVFLTRPLSAALLAVAALVLMAPVALRLLSYNVGHGSNNGNGDGQGRAGHIEKSHRGGQRGQKPGTE
jgi:putative tricarboxylic transport membrane protein